jgi:hypothetical protein
MEETTNQNRRRQTAGGSKGDIMTETTPAPAKPKKLSEEQTKNMLKNWRHLCELSRQRERTILQLLRHPDTTIEQIDEVRKVYAQAYKQLKEARQQLETAYETGRIYKSFAITQYIHNLPISLA